MNAGAGFHKGQHKCQIDHQTLYLHPLHTVAVNNEHFKPLRRGEVLLDVFKNSVTQQVSSRQQNSTKVAVVLKRQNGRGGILPCKFL